MSNRLISVGKLKMEQRPALAQNVIRMRTQRGWNQAELAHRVGVHKNIITKIESGKGEGEPATRQAIADALGCSLSDLYLKPDHKAASPSRQRSLTTRTVGEMTPEELRELILSTKVPDDPYQETKSSSEIELLNLIHEAGRDKLGLILDFVKTLTTAHEAQARPRRRRVK